MILHLALTAACAVLLLNSTSRAAVSASPFYGDPPDDHHPWAVHDGNRPQPKVVTPGTFSTPEQPGKPPSDAIILFDGTRPVASGKRTSRAAPTKWVVKDGAMECVPGSGDIRTKESSATASSTSNGPRPAKVARRQPGPRQQRHLPDGHVEIQVLDNYNNPTYADGHRRLGLRRQSADGQRPAPARRVPGL